MRGTKGWTCLIKVRTYYFAKHRFRVLWLISCLYSTLFRPRFHIFIYFSIIILIIFYSADRNKRKFSERNRSHNPITTSDPICYLADDLLQSLDHRHNKTFFFCDGGQDQKRGLAKACKAARVSRLQSSCASHSESTEFH